MGWSHVANTAGFARAANNSEKARGSCRSRGRQERAHRSLENRKTGFPQATTGSIFFAGNRNSVTHVPGRLTLLPMFPVAPTDAVRSYAAPSRLTSIIVMSLDCRAVPRKRTTVAMIASSAPTGLDRPGPAMAAVGSNDLLHDHGCQPESRMLSGTP